MPPNGAPIIVSGPGRCGSTWMQFFLSAHPDLHIHGQLPSGVNWAHLHKFCQSIVDAGTAAGVSNHKIGYPVPHYSGSPPNRTRDLFARFLRDYTAGHAKANGKPRWGGKWIGLVDHPDEVEQVEALWPGVLWVVCLRDPFAGAESLANTFRRKAGIDAVPGYLAAWVRTAQFASEHRPNVAGFLIDRVAELSPIRRQAMCGMILTHLGLPPASETTDFVDRWPTIHKAVEDKDRKFHLTDDDRSRLLDQVDGLADHMTRLGYPIPCPAA